jgi:hypothetical protein
MKLTKGKGNPQIINKILKEKFNLSWFRHKGFQFHS